MDDKMTEQITSAEEAAATVSASSEGKLLPNKKKQWTVSSVTSMLLALIPLIGYAPRGFDGWMIK